MSAAPLLRTGASELPASLVPWAPFLAALTPRLAVALGPLIRRLDGLMAASHTAASAHGDFAGYGGIARRGRPDLLLASEWLLADAFEEEFLRRAVDGELLHLSPEFTDARAGGTVRALMDAGPHAAGSGRLVQLAGIVVLGRRAEARGAELAVRVLGHDSGRELRGTTYAVLSGWLEARRDRPPTADDVAEALAGLGADDEAWVFGSERLVGAVPAPARLVTTADGRWTAAGAASVRVAVGGAAPADLPLPERELALRALRGAEFRRHAPVRVPAKAVVRGAAPAFTGATAHLILRGQTPDEIVSVYTPSAPGQQAGRVKRYSFPGVVVGASWIGRRLVAVCLTDRRLSVHVEGRAWRGLPVDALGGSVNRLADRPEFVASLHALAPAPVFLFDHGVVTHLDDRWVHVRRGEIVEKPWISVGPGPALDRPLRSTMGDGQVLVVEGWAEPFRAHRVRGHLIGGRAVAWRSADAALWRVQAEGGYMSAPIRVDTDATPVGLALHEEVPYLVTASESGAVAVCSPSGKQVFAGSSAAGGVAVHPVLPLWAGGDAAGCIRVRHVATGDEVLTLRGDV